MSSEHNIEQKKCNCQEPDTAEITRVVESVVERIGRERYKVIPILQAVQNDLNWLPSYALRHISKITEITPGQISGVSTFYSQFRHIPAGEHIIKICKGTACHVKGAPLVTDAFKRELKLKEGSSTTDDGRFSIEEVACLGCCTLAPVVQIGGKTYGHVKTSEVNQIISDFNNSEGKTGEELPEITATGSEKEIRVGLGSCCIAGGSRDVMHEVYRTLKRYKIKATVKTVGCVGVCNQTPLLELDDQNGNPVRYTKVKEEQVSEILLNHLRSSTLPNRFRTYFNDWVDTFSSDDKLRSPITIPGEIREKYLNNFLQNQKHIATEHYGVISPFSIDEYVRLDGFIALEQAIKVIGEDGIINEITRSGLRGRGGGGFLTGDKWRITRETQDRIKYIICNGDEGDPGAFMDRMLLESFPFRVLEGMIISGFTTGAREGIFYIRAEYPLAVERVRNAINECKRKGFLGKNIYGSGFSFNVSVFEGAGAFVCGEESALISSVEGDRGNPRFRPPYPAVKGLNGKPTLVNNVETLCMVPWIIRHGADEFNSVGTPDSKGTKVFALAGKVARGGLIEVPMGITIRKIVEDIGGGVAPERKFKAVQIGGPSGGCIPESLADTPVDFDELTKLGAMMGSGGLVVLDDSDCMIDMAKYFLTFTHEQSCGKCTFCRIGTGQILRILDRFSKGEAGINEIEELEELCYSIKNGSLCGLGKSAPNPVLTSIIYFREEYEAHASGVCPAKKCPALIRYRVNDDCIGCTKCVRVCPVNAIEYRPYEKHEIDFEKCIKCDSCRAICPVDAIDK